VIYVKIHPEDREQIRRHSK